MRTFLLTALLLCGCLLGRAQTAFRLTEESVVKDSSGAVYPYAIWKALLMKDYSIKPVNANDPNTEFLLVKLTPKQVAYRLEKAPKPKESKSFTTGEKLTLFNTRDINNNKIELKNVTGKIIVLNFWFVNCGPCRMEIPALNDLVDSFSTNDKVQFIAVALDDKGSIRDFLKTTPFKYHIIDNGKFITDKYNIASYPTHVIIDTAGRVYFHTMGLAPNTVHWLDKSIRELLAQDASTTATN